MTDSFTEEPHIGHYVEAERFDPSTERSRQIHEPFDLPPRNTERIRFTVADVGWDDVKSLHMDVETFEAIIEWYKSKQSSKSLSFYRTTRENSNENVYVFVREDGSEIRLPPGTTVSELQNRL